MKLLVCFVLLFIAAFAAAEMQTFYTDYQCLSATFNLLDSPTASEDFAFCPTVISTSAWYGNFDSTNGNSVEFCFTLDMPPVFGANALRAYYWVSDYGNPSTISDDYYTIKGYGSSSPCISVENHNYIQYSAGLTFSYTTNTTESEGYVWGMENTPDSQAPIFVVHNLTATQSS